MTTKMSQAKMLKNSFDDLLRIEGVDGYAVLDSEFIVIDSRAGFRAPVGHQELFADVFSASFSGDAADISTAIVLAERGAWLLAQLPGIPEVGQPAYLVVLAGTQQPVDIPQLEATVAASLR